MRRKPPYIFAMILALFSVINCQCSSSTPVSYALSPQTIVSSSASSRNLFDMPSTVYSCAASSSVPCTTSTNGVSVRPGTSTKRYQYVTFDLTVACGSSFSSSYSCPLTTGYSWTYSRTDNLPACRSVSVSTAVHWQRSRRNVTTTSSSYTSNLFDLSSAQFSAASNPSDACDSPTSGVSVTNGVSTSRYMSVTFDLGIACGANFQSSYVCPLTTGASVIVNRTDTLPVCDVSIAVYWKASSKIITNDALSYTNRNLFDLSSEQYNIASNPSDACYSPTPGVSVNNGGSTARYMSVTFNINIACGGSFSSSYICPLTTGQSVIVNRTDTLPACSSTTSTNVSTNPSWIASRKTITNTASSYTNRNLFDLSYTQFNLASNPSDACSSQTPGVSVNNGAGTARYMSVTFNLSIACGTSFTSSYSCPLTTGQSVILTRTDVLPACSDTNTDSNTSPPSGGVSLAIIWSASSKTITNTASSYNNRNLFDLSTPQYNVAVNSSKACYSTTAGVSVRNSYYTSRYQYVNFDLTQDGVCGTFQSQFVCPLTTGQNVTYNRTDTLPSCTTSGPSSGPSSVDTSIYWKASRKTITNTASSYSNRNLFDLSSTQLSVATDPSDACYSTTPGVSINNGNITARYMAVTFDLSIACGTDFLSSYICPLTTGQSVNVNRTDTLPCCNCDVSPPNSNVSTAVTWKASRKTITNTPSSYNNRNLFDLSTIQFNVASNPSDACTSQTEGVSVNNGRTTERYMSVSFDLTIDSVCGTDFNSSFVCLLTTGQNVTVNRIDDLPSCDSTETPSTNVSTAVYWKASRKTITNLQSSYSNRNLFDLSSAQYNVAQDLNNSCSSSTPGVTVRNGQSIKRYQYVTFDLNVACGLNFNSTYVCQLTTDQNVVVNRTDTLPQCSGPTDPGNSDVSIAVTWKASRKTITNSAISYRNRNLFDLSSAQYRVSQDQNQSCSSPTPGVSVTNGASVRRYQYVTFDLSIACGLDFVSSYVCPLSTDQVVIVNRTDTLPQCNSSPGEINGVDLTISWIASSKTITNTYYSYTARNLFDLTSSQFNIASNSTKACYSPTPGVSVRNGASTSRYQYVTFDLNEASACGSNFTSSYICPLQSGQNVTLNRTDTLPSCGGGDTAPSTNVSTAVYWIASRKTITNTSSSYNNRNLFDLSQTQFSIASNSSDACYSQTLGVSVNNGASTQRYMSVSFDLTIDNVCGTDFDSQFICPLSTGQNVTVNRTDDLPPCDGDPTNPPQSSNVSLVISWSASSKTITNVSSSYNDRNLFDLSSAQYNVAENSSKACYSTTPGVSVRNSYYTSRYQYVSFDLTVNNVCGTFQSSFVCPLTTGQSVIYNRTDTLPQCANTCPVDATVEYPQSSQTVTNGTGIWLFTIPSTIWPCVLNETAPCNSPTTGVTVERFSSNYYRDQRVYFDLSADDTCGSNFESSYECPLVGGSSWTYNRSDDLPTCITDISLIADWTASSKIITNSTNTARNLFDLTEDQFSIVDDSANACYSPTDGVSVTNGISTIRKMLVSFNLDVACGLNFRSSFVCPLNTGYNVIVNRTDTLPVCLTSTSVEVERSSPSQTINSSPQTFRNRNLFDLSFNQYRLAVNQSSPCQSLTTGVTVRSDSNNGRKQMVSFNTNVACGEVFLSSFECPLQNGESVILNRVDTLLECPPSTEPYWLDVQQNITTSPSSWRNRNLFDLSAKQMRYAVNITHPCSSLTDGVTVAKGLDYVTGVSQMVTFNLTQGLCGANFPSTFQCPMIDEDGLVVQVERVDNLPECPPDLEADWEQSKQTITEATSQNNHMFDLTAKQYLWARNESKACDSSTPGVAVENDPTTPRYQLVSFNTSIACGVNFASNFECTLQRGLIISVNRTDNLPECPPSSEIFQDAQLPLQQISKNNRQSYRDNNLFNLTIEQQNHLANESKACFSSTPGVSVKNCDYTAKRQCVTFDLDNESPEACGENFNSNFECALTGYNNIIYNRTDNLTRCGPSTTIYWQASSKNITNETSSWRNRNLFDLSATQFAWAANQAKACRSKTDGVTVRNGAYTPRYQEVTFNLDEVCDSNFLSQFECALTNGAVISINRTDNFTQCRDSTTEQWEALPRTISSLQPRNIHLFNLSESDTLILQNEQQACTTDTTGVSVLNGQTSDTRRKQMVSFDLAEPNVCGSNFPSQFVCALTEGGPITINRVDNLPDCPPNTTVYWEASPQNIEDTIHSYRRQNLFDLSPQQFNWAENQNQACSSGTPGVIVQNHDTIGRYQLVTFDINVACGTNFTSNYSCPYRDELGIVFVNRTDNLPKCPASDGKSWEAPPQTITNDPASYSNRNLFDLSIDDFNMAMNMRKACSSTTPSVSVQNGDQERRYQQVTFDLTNETLCGPNFRSTFECQMFKSGHVVTFNRTDNLPECIHSCPQQLDNLTVSWGKSPQKIASNTERQKLFQLTQDQSACALNQEQPCQTTNVGFNASIEIRKGIYVSDQQVSFQGVFSQYCGEISTSYECPMQHDQIVEYSRKDNLSDCPSLDQNQGAVNGKDKQRITNETNTVQLFSLNSALEQYIKNSTKYCKSLTGGVTVQNSNENPRFQLVTFDTTNETVCGDFESQYSCPMVFDPDGVIYTRKDILPQCQSSWMKQFEDLLKSDIIEWIVGVFIVAIVLVIFACLFGDIFRCKAQKPDKHETSKGNDVEMKSAPIDHEKDIKLEF